MGDYAFDVLLICHNIVAIGRKTIARGEFEENTPHMAIYTSSLQMHDTRCSTNDSSEILFCKF